MADRDSSRDTSDSIDHDRTGNRGGTQGGTQAGAGNTLGRMGSDVAGQATELGRQALDGTQGRIRGLLEQQTERAADQIGGVAAALHKAAEHLGEENNRVVAQYVGQAADRVDEMADLIRNSTLDDMLTQVEGFARRQPEMFVGGALALGFLAARFIKSSGEGHRRAPDYGPGYGPSAGFPAYGGERDRPRNTVRSSRPEVGRPEVGRPSRPMSESPSRGTAERRDESSVRGTPYAGAGAAGVSGGPAAASAGRAASTSPQDTLGSSPASTADSTGAKSSGAASATGALGNAPAKAAATIPSTGGQDGRKP